LVSIFDRAAREPDGLALDDLTRRRSWAELVDVAAAGPSSSIAARASRTSCATTWASGPTTTRPC
jgi:hypothetical protein